MNFFINHIESSIQNAEEYKSKLPIGVLEFDGFAGFKTRHFLNNLCSLNGLTYCEVGTYKGATASAALFGNNIKIICIDNFSQFEKEYNVCGLNNVYIETKKQCFYNLNLVTKFSTGKGKVKFYIKDYKDVAFDDKIDIYLYDGFHSIDEQRNGIKHFYNNFEDQFILLVDDYVDTESETDYVRITTLKTLSELNLKIEAAWYLKGAGGDDLNVKMHSYWEGMGVFLLRK